MLDGLSPTVALPPHVAPAPDSAFPSESRHGSNRAELLPGAGVSSSPGSAVTVLGVLELCEAGAVDLHVEPAAIGDSASRPGVLAQQEHLRGGLEAAIWMIHSRLAAEIERRVSCQLVREAIRRWPDLVLGRHEAAVAEHRGLGSQIALRAHAVATGGCLRAGSAARWAALCRC